jgi:hypothetical protein
MKEIIMDTNKRTARVAGLLYLIVAITGFFSPYVRGRIIVNGDAAATANNIMNSEWLFRIGFVSDLIMVTSWILLVFALYKLFESVNKNYGLLMIAFVLVGSTITCINALNKFAALLALNGADYFTTFGTGQLQGLAMLFLDLCKSGNFIAHIFFGLWLFPLSYLVIKSGFIPRILGALLAVAGFGYLIDFFTFFLSPNFGVTVTPFTFWGELLLLLWLLIKGVAVQKPATTEEGY